MQEEIVSSSVMLPDEVSVAIAQASHGMQFQKTQTNFVQMIGTVKPRIWNDVERAAISEAAIAGEEFYYSWKQGGSVVEGLTIGAAISLFRSLGNGYVTAVVQSQDKDSYVINGVYIDIERNIVIERPFLQPKDSIKRKDGKSTYSDSRSLSVNFSIGVSKAIRNAILSAIPKWLIKKVMIKAKEGVVRQIENMGTVKAQKMVMDKIERLKINEERVFDIYGKPKGWDTVKLVNLSSALTAIENGYEEADDLFPPLESEKALLNKDNDLKTTKVTTEIPKETASKQNSKTDKKESEKKKEEVKEHVEVEEEVVNEFERTDNNDFDPNYREEFVADEQEQFRLSLINREPKNLKELTDSANNLNTRNEHKEFREKFKVQINALYNEHPEEVKNIFNNLKLKD